MSLVECIVFVFQLSFLTLGKASTHRKLAGFLNSAIKQLPVRWANGVAICKQINKILLTRYTMLGHPPRFFTQAIMHTLMKANKQPKVTALSQLHVMSSLVDG